MGIKWYLVNDGKDAINVALITRIKAYTNWVVIYSFDGEGVCVDNKDLATVIAEIATITGSKQ